MTNITTREAQQKPPVKQMNSTAKVLLDIGTRKLSGRLTIREPNADPIYWRIYFGNGQVHFATSATGQRERLSYFLQRYFPELTPSKRDEFHSDYQYLCRYWKSGQLSLQQIRKLLFALSQEAMVQLLALPQATLQFEKTVGLDPLVLSVPLKQIVAPLQVNTRQWTQLRPEIGSPFQRPFVANPGQFAQLLRPKVRENAWFQSLSAALTQNHCLYEVAGQVKIDALQLAILLQPLVRAGAVGIHPFTLPQADERRIIACIDDSKTVQRNVKLTLEAAGYRVLGLMEPARALTMLVRHKPALVLMDISMPEIDGYELCRMLRQSTFLKDIPIVMLTGRDGFIDRLRARVVGANDYMTKPFAPKQLLATVRNRLSLTGVELMKTVLVVDDSRSEQRLIVSLLKYVGLEVVLATTAESAWKWLADNEQPNLILLDIVMPGLNGLELCRKIRANSQFTNVPIVFCSCKAQEWDRFWALRQGGNAYITKPFIPHELIQTVREYLN